MTIFVKSKIMMAYNPNLTEKIRKALQLHGVSDLEEKKMFRGITFMVNGKMCISVGDTEIMCRIDPSLHEEAIQKTGCRSMEMKGKTYKGYVFVKEEAVSTEDDFEYWILLALDFNQRAKASKKKK
jgi:TfoX/Sxy family transcriptional regulator of competence genes